MARGFPPREQHSGRLEQLPTGVRLQVCTLLGRAGAKRGWSAATRCLPGTPNPGQPQIRGDPCFPLDGQVFPEEFLWPPGGCV